jgi:hypothetical protein
MIRQNHCNTKGKPTTAITTKTTTTTTTTTTTQ